MCLVCECRYRLYELLHFHFTSKPHGECDGRSVWVIEVLMEMLLPVKQGVYHK